MKKSRIKKYPIFTYLCCLLLVSVLFTGVTFSRYALTTSGSAGAGAAAFGCSYEIEDFSSLNFDNSNYWVSAGSEGEGESYITSATPRTVRFTMRNFDGEGRVSGVDVRAHMRIYISAELADSLAVQISTGVQTSAGGAYTPQIPLGELFYGRSGGTNANGTPALNAAYADYGSGTALNSSSFYDYGAQTAADEQFTVSGGLGTQSRTLTLESSAEQGGSGLVMTVSAGEQLVEYSVGFRRGVSETPLYLDLRREQTFYTIDITLPAMRYAGGGRHESTHVAYFTLTDRLENSARWYDNITKGNGGYTTAIDGVGEAIAVTPVFAADGALVEDMARLVTDPAQGYYFLQNGDRIDITGYHFEQTAPVAGGAEGQTTTVRIKCAYAEEAGMYNVSLYHVAPLSENAAYYVHPITWNGGQNSLSCGYMSDSSPFASYEDGGVCSNGGQIDISGITMNALRIEGKEADITIAVNRSYYFDMYALFVQDSQVG